MAESNLIDWTAARVLCVGDIMLDRFVEGDVSRISPEAPVPIFHWGSERLMLGGAGNVLANLTSLGVTVSLVSRIGRDEAGRMVRQLTAAEGVEGDFLESDRVPTIQKTRFAAKGHHVLRLDRETIVPLAPEEEKALLAAIEAKLPTVDAVVFSDYAKGCFTPAFTQRAIERCRRAGKPVLVDPKGKDYAKYAGATLVKPNRAELEVACGVTLSPSSPGFLGAVENAARDLIRRCRIDRAIVTLSEKGMLFVGNEDGERAYLPTEGRDVCDVSGAGDTTMAVLAASCALKLPLPEAMRWANAAAGIVVGKVGTAVVRPDELKRKHAALANTLGPVSRKIFCRSELAKQVTRWQNEGLSVGFTNGCFDCLHCGHLSSLYQAREHCDKLVVAVNSDASVRRLKGPTRPIQNQETRCLVLSGLELTDAVIVFDEDTALPLVQALRPDVIAKEGYSLANWPEAQFVISMGGEAVTLKRVEGYSTSSLVERMTHG